MTKDVLDGSLTNLFFFLPPNNNIIKGTKAQTQNKSREKGFQT